jgi:2-keto-4-pentenoate hydratase/2-oxohepta-3-ene-1,7-dioic acid hydratase in catechol pathway
VETDIDLAAANDLTIQCTVNGEQRQLGSTSQMIHPIADLIVNISEAMTLLPGDVILTGTPAGVGPLNVGDEVAVTIEGIGTLTNKVIKRG